MSDCIFCKIVDGDIPSDKVYEDDRILCFRDLDPQAPVHVLMIPKKHISSCDDISDDDAELAGYMLSMVKKIAADLDLEKGYRVVVNNGEYGQQTVPHLHLHILGGRKMTWPPG